MVGCTYAAVPLYRRFCQATGYGGTVQRKEVKFDHFVASYLLLSFKDDVYVVCDLLFSYNSYEKRKFCDNTNKISLIW